MPVYYLVSSVVVVGVEDRPPLGDLGCALRHRPALVLRSHPGVAPWLPHEGLADGEGGRSHELVPPGAVLRQVCPLGEHRREVEVVQVALERPAVGPFLFFSPKSNLGQPPTEKNENFRCRFLSKDPP